MIQMTDIEQATEAYATARRELQDRVASLRQGIDSLVRSELDSLRLAADAAADREAHLTALIEQAPALFEQPRTQTFHRVKVGFAKRKGKVTFESEAKTIALIRRHLPDEQVELLINVKESVAKSAVNDLSAADLKRLGITVAGDTDQVVIRAAGDDLDKLVRGLMGQIIEQEPQAA